MAQKISYDAESPKKGMSLAELKKAVDNAEGLAQVNEHVPEDSKVTVFVNFTGGIKQITVEV